MSSDILVVDDEVDIRELVAAILEDDGYAVRTAQNAEAALAALRARKPALLILDIWMSGNGMDGLELLDRVRALDPDLPVIMISGHGTIETAVSSIRRGAYDFIEKPFKSDRLLLVVQRALEASSLRRENRHLRAQAVVPEGLVGSSSAAQQLRAIIAKIASANSRVLISGPPGAGKETAARLIHAASPRAPNAFVAISAAGVTPERMDRELFGEEPTAERPGHIASSSGLMPGRSIWMRSPRCRARPRAGFCVSWWSSDSAVWAGKPMCRSMCGLSLRHHGIWRPKSPPGGCGRTFSIVSMWCRCVCRASPSGERIFRS
jgi:two-component system nitrogen regulation response regulator NtrX